MPFHYQTLYWSHTSSLKDSNVLFLFICLCQQYSTIQSSERTTLFSPMLSISSNFRPLETIMSNFRVILIIRHTNYGPMMYRFQILYGQNHKPNLNRYFIKISEKHSFFVKKNSWLMHNQELWRGSDKMSAESSIENTPNTPFGICWRKSHI